MPEKSTVRWFTLILWYNCMIADPKIVNSISRWRHTLLSLLISSFDYTRLLLTQKLILLVNLVSLWLALWRSQGSATHCSDCVYVCIHTVYVYIHTYSDVWGEGLLCLKSSVNISVFHYTYKYVFGKHRFTHAKQVPVELSLYLPNVLWRITNTRETWAPTHARTSY